MEKFAILTNPRNNNAIIKESWFQILEGVGEYLDKATLRFLGLKYWILKIDYKEY